MDEWPDCWWEGGWKDLVLDSQTVAALDGWKNG